MTRPFAVLMLLVAVSACTWSCSDDPSGVERESPMIRIVFPTEDEYDRDGDGLVDIEIAFFDNEGGSGIDPSTLIVQSSRPLGPNATGGNDLMASFEVIVLDTNRVVLEETINTLLPRGSITLAAQVADRAGNRGQASRVIGLPPGALHRFIDPDVATTDPLGVEIVPGGIGFLLTSEAEVVPFDPQDLTIGEPVSTGGVRDPVDGEYDPESGRLFLVSDAVSSVIVVDPFSLTIEAPIPISSRAISITRAPSGLLYIALASTNASISIVDPTLRAELRVVETELTDLVNPGFPAFVTTPAVLAGEEELLFALKFAPGGARRVSANTGEVLSTIDLGSQSTLVPLGLAVDSVFDPSRRLLFITTRSEPPFRGLVVVDVETEAVVARLDGRERPGRLLTRSPSGRYLFVTLSSPDGEVNNGENWLVDALSFSVLQRFPSSRALGGDNRPAFREDEQLVFVPSASGIDVYLIRH